MCLEQEVGLVYLEQKMDYGEKYVMILDCKYNNYMFLEIDKLYMKEITQVIKEQDHGEYFIDNIIMKNLQKCNFV